MALILITDNPQGGACRCEGQAQTLDLAKLKPEQVEALKQALGINETAGEGQELDLANLKPEQVEALKQALGINANASQGAGAVDFSALSPEQIEALKTALGVNTAAGSGADINSLLKAEIDPSAFSEVEGAENIKHSDIFLGGRSTAHVIWNLDTENSMIQSALGNLIQDLILKGVIKHSDYMGCLGNWMFSDIPE